MEDTLGHKIQLAILVPVHRHFAALLIAVDIFDEGDVSAHVAHYRHKLT